MRTVVTSFIPAPILSLALIVPILSTSCSTSTSTSAVEQGCNSGSVPPSRSTLNVQPGQATQIALEAAKDAGVVIASGQGTTNRTIFVFEERHDSRMGQLEIALMLWRLQKNHGLRQISLEGAFATKGDLPTTWFHDSTGSAAVRRARKEAALRLLKEGEISAAEFLALALPTIQVRGNELESEYDVKPSQTNASLGCLIRIAQRSLSSSDEEQIEELFKAKKIDEGFNAIFRKDTWSRERYEKLFGDNIVSTEEAEVILREIEAKAKEFDVNFDSKERTGFREDLAFYEMASKRSCTIVKNTLAMMGSTSTAPIALIIGAAHTPKVVELIKAAKLTYVVVSPLALVHGSKAATLTPAMYHRKMDLKSTDENGMLGALLDGRKKLRPVVWEVWLRSKASIYVALDHIVAAVSQNERISPLTLEKELGSFESIKIDWSSMKIIKDGDRVRVMIKVTAQTDDSPEQKKDIWALGWYQPPPPPPEGPQHAPVPLDDDSDMEKLIKAEIEKAKNQAVDTTKPLPVAIVQVSTRTMAAFASDPVVLQRVTAAR
jgi:hypothetical protein